MAACFGDGDGDGDGDGAGGPLVPIALFGLRQRFHGLGQEPWSSGYGRRLMFKRSWVQIPAQYTGWTFFCIDLFVKIVLFV